MKCMMACLLPLIAAVFACEIPCTKEMNPVCATDGVNFQVFSNECMMHNQKCKDGKAWLKSDLRSCNILKEPPALPAESGVDANGIPKCLKVCSMLPLPICGHDGKTYQLFGNSCAMSNANCLLEGETVYKAVGLDNCNHADGLLKKRNLNRSNCILACPAIYSPICGFNGSEYKMFDNSCTMRAQNCLRSENWRSASFELCPNEIYA